MPYYGFGRKVYRSRSNFRTRFTRSRYRGEPVTKKVKRVVRRVNAKEASDLQWFTTSNNAASGAGAIVSIFNNAGSSSSNGIVSLSAGIAAGTANSNRIGYKVGLKFLEIRGYVTQTSVASPPLTMNVGRIIVWSVKNNQLDAVGTGGSASDPAVLIQDWAVGYAGVINNFHPEVVPGQARILKDAFINPMMSTGGTTGKVIPFHWKFDLEKHFRGQPTTWSSTTGSAGVALNNHIFICFIQGETVGVPTNGSIQATWAYSLKFSP